MLLKLWGLVRTKDLILKFLDLITITVPPGLPVSMTFGIIYAIDKLKKK
jgi:magnesium-transporting ATPase (P-type)